MKILLILSHKYKNVPERQKSLRKAKKVMNLLRDVRKTQRFVIILMIYPLNSGIHSKNV